MALLCSTYPAIDPERIPFMPWPLTAGLLGKLPLIEFRRHAHTAQLSQIVAATMGGSKAQFTDFLMGFARVGELGQAGELQLRLKGQEAVDFRLGLKKGVISQRMLNYMVA